MSKNWIPMAKDFSSEATDLKEKSNLLLLYKVQNYKSGRDILSVLARHF